MYKTALILPSDVKNPEPIMFYEGIMPKISGAIAIAVTSRSSSLDYTRLVHAGAKRNSCNTVVSPDTHQTTTNFAETMCKTDINSFVNSEDPNLLASSETT